MKRTLYVVDYDDATNKTTVRAEKITCECVGEMASGEKVWCEVNSGNQYLMGRVKGKNGVKGCCYFYLLSVN